LIFVLLWLFFGFFLFPLFFVLAFFLFFAPTPSRLFPRLAPSSPRAVHWGGVELCCWGGGVGCAFVAGE